MGADIKTLRTRIKSVDSTLHLTKAMGLVASSKIRKANDAMNKAKQYSNAFDRAIAALSASSECRKSPYMATNNSGKVKIILIAGDRGLAGGYNANIFRFVREYPNAEIIPIGKRACERFEKPIISSETYSFDEAYALSESLCSEFVEGKLDKVGIISTEYISMMTQSPIITWLLPLEKSEEKNTGMIFEPDELTVLNSSVKEYVAGHIMCAIRESFASEVVARRMAMDSAGKNAKKMIDDLQLKYNRARQGAITQEITEIVAGSGN